MSDYITIPTGLLRAIAHELEFAAGPDPDDFADVPVAMVESVAQYMRDSDSDDHSVGLCTCDTNALAYSLELALDHLMVCPGCGGDGMAWDETKAQEQAERNPDWSDCFAGCTTCPKCNGKGTVPISY